MRRVTHTHMNGQRRKRLNFVSLHFMANHLCTDTAEVVSRSRERARYLLSQRLCPQKRESVSTLHFLGLNLWSQRTVTGPQPRSGQSVRLCGPVPVLWETPLTFLWLMDGHTLTLRKSFLFIYGHPYAERESQSERRFMREHISFLIFGFMLACSYLPFS
jgi:hypothetical protein